MKGDGTEEFRTKITTYARYWHLPQKISTYPTLMIKGSKHSPIRLQKHFNDRNIKCLGKRKKWVSTPLVRSMRTYAHILGKDSKERDIS